VARRTRPRSGALELSEADALAQVSFVVVGTLGRRAAEYGVSVIQTRLLGILRDRTPPMSELSKLLELDKSSVTGLVDRAEQRGLVARVPSRQDGRSVRVTLTDEGRALVGEFAAGFEADVAELLEGLSDRQRSSLTRLLERVVERYAARRGLDLAAGVTQRGTGGEAG
jgi:MarR family transcriptional regulator, lower aerobic nicotinate degradation pathway regulator